jgi:hypothetical protein
MRFIVVSMAVLLTGCSILKPSQQDTAITVKPKIMDSPLPEKPDALQKEQLQGAELDAAGWNKALLPQHTQFMKSGTPKSSPKAESEYNQVTTSAGAAKLAAESEQFSKRLQNSATTGNASTDHAGSSLEESMASLNKWKGMIDEADAAARSGDMDKHDHICFEAAKTADTEDGKGLSLIMFILGPAKYRGDWDDTQKRLDTFLSQSDAGIPPKVVGKLKELKEHLPEMKEKSHGGPMISASK